MLKRIAVAALMSTALCSMSWADTNGPIRSVTLSSGGMAEIVRSASVEDKGTVRMDIPLEQVDDILKSLVVRDPTGKVKDITLAGPTPIEETFRTLPFTASDLNSVPTLLSTIQGTAVSVTSGGKSVDGQVLGVEIRPNGEGSSKPLLTVLTAEGNIDTLWLADDTVLKVVDPDMRRKISDAISATGKGKNGGSRTVTVGVGGEGNRSVDLSYVVSTPIWKTAYRVVVGKEGKARLQAWAVLENASGEDWKDVKITLSSGDPVTLSQRLHQRYWRDRTEVPVDTASNDGAIADTGNLSNRTAAKSKRSAALGGERANMMAALAPSPRSEVMAEGAAQGFDMAQASDTGIAKENDVNAIFVLPGSYDLANGDTLSIPIVDATVEAEMVSVFRPDTGSAHPVAAVMLNNSTENSLPPGILTVYDDSDGYVGDSRLLGLPVGDKRIASFATDGKVTIVQDRQPAQQVMDVKVVDGMIHASMKSIDNTTYTVTGAVDGDRTVVIEHPRMEGWTFKSSADDGETATRRRLKVKVASGTQEKVTATYEMIRDDIYALTDSEPQMLVSWAEAADNEETAQKLKGLAEARRQQMSNQNALQLLEGELTSEGEKQARIRENLSAVPETSDLHKKYLKMLEDHEDKIADIESRKDEALKASTESEKNVRDAIRTF